MSRKSQPAAESEAGPRLDKWLWAARFFKTRTLAKEAIEAGRVRVNSERVKPGRVPKVGDELELRINDLDWRVRIEALSDRRGPAPEARLLYSESEASRLAREKILELRRLSWEPAREIHGRPSKRDARLIHRFTESS